MNLVSVTPVVSTSAYTANDAVGGQMTFGGVPEQGWVNSISIIDKDNQKAPLTLVLYDNDFTEDTDNAAYSVEADDIDNIIGVINITADDYTTIGSIAVATVPNVNIPFNRGTGRYSIDGQMMTTGTPTYTSTTALIVKLGVMSDGEF